TRSGLIDSVHTFAQSDVGNYFIGFLIVLAISSVGLILWRVLDGSLQSDAPVGSLWSREGVFLLNNIVLLASVVIVMFGTLGEKISAYFWMETKYSASWFNAWMVPGGLLLLFLMGVGPLFPWRRVTRRALLKNLLIPSLVSTFVVAALIYGDVYHLKTQLLATNFDGVSEKSLGRLLLDAELTGVYATLGFWGVVFICYTMTAEFVKGARVRQRGTKEGFVSALSALSLKNKRRYGGFLSHIGFALLFLGFIGTGLKTERDLSFYAVGQREILEDKLLTFKGIQYKELREYREWSAEFDVHQLNEDGSEGEKLGTLFPARRNYLGENVQLSRSTTEKDELFLWKANVYLTLISFNPGKKTAELMAHYNPMIIWMWIGGAVMLFGIFLSLWPEEERYQVFAAAQRRYRQSVARALGLELRPSSSGAPADATARLSSSGGES
ncbi:MAG: cytochrome c-type biogenesis CcmF C-terminal domain-containing protein, partial [Myxococcota bacterium]|nr:cytochrome c-type biogenesis CcmF C-terminal domain-containing protein [Myxococcota bacterium]